MEDTQSYLSVFDAVTLAKDALSSLPSICVAGEVSGFRGPNARSGHCYFQLKDAQASMDTIIWRSTYENANIELKDGMQIEARGSFSVYAASGKMSFVITSFHLVGEGALRQQVALLAKKLQAEGLMDDARKRPIPRFCNRICVCTSLSGSVIDDVKRTLARRNPLVVIQVVGCAVQGAHAPETICRALRVAQEAAPDAILLVRGGGSFEDLMCFNDERVARAVAASTIPVITGIGHEPDVSICDLVSDRRTSTPTAAAESVAPALDELQHVLAQRQDRLQQWRRSTITQASSELAQSRERLLRAQRSCLSRAASYVASLAQHQCLLSSNGFLIDKRTQLELTSERFYAARGRMFTPAAQMLQTNTANMQHIARSLVSSKRHAVDLLATSLEALNPLYALKRGYSLVQDEHGHVITSACACTPGDDISIWLKSGAVSAHVTSVDTDAQLMSH